jgi:hypothetical protein
LFVVYFAVVVRFVVFVFGAFVWQNVLYPHKRSGLPIYYCAIGFLPTPPKLLQDSDISIKMFTATPFFCGTNHRWGDFVVIVA